MLALIKVIMSKFIEYYQRSRYSNEEIASTISINKARKMGVTVGEACRFFSLNFSTEPFLIEIGNHVTITNNVIFSTHDGGVWVFREKYPEIDLFGKIKIGNNVFIGMGSNILLNTYIPDNCIIAAGSVVKGKFEPNSVIAGVPAKRICSIEEYYEKNKLNFTYFRSNYNKNELVKRMFVS